MHDRFLPCLSSDLGGVWPFRIHCPRGSRFAFVPARLRHVFCLRPGALFFPVQVPKVPLRQLVHDRFLPCLSSDLGGVWPFRIHCPEAPVLRLSRLGCVPVSTTDFVHDDDVPLAAVLLCPLCHCPFGIRGPLHMGGRRHGR